jgi:hypothetical protein
MVWVDHVNVQVAMWHAERVKTCRYMQQMWNKCENVYAVDWFLYIKWKCEEIPKSTIVIKNNVIYCMALTKPINWNKLNKDYSEWYADYFAIHLLVSGECDKHNSWITDWTGG